MVFISSIVFFFPTCVAGVTVVAEGVVSDAAIALGCQKYIVEYFKNQHES